MDQIKSLPLYAFKGAQSSIFTGRLEGRTARRQLKLNDWDTKANYKVLLTIPEGTTSFNPSFYLGLLFESFKTLGQEGFNKKYGFEIATKDPQMRRVIEKNLADGMRNAINALQSKTALTVSH